MYINSNIYGAAISTDQSQSMTKPNDPLEVQKQKLYKAAKDMESIFLYHMLQSMRKTVPESEGSKAALGGGMGKDVYMQMFDQELANKMSGTGQRSMADMLYDDLEKVLERQAGILPQAKPLDKSIMPKTESIPVKIKSIPINTEERNTSLNGVRKNTGNDFYPIIRSAAEKYNLDPELLKSVIKAESGGNPMAESPAGAKGLMQLMDTTAAEVGVTDSFDPEQNINGGAKYLRQMINRFGDVKTALAAYNAGPGTVERYGGVPPYREPRAYLDKILGENEF